MTLSTDAKRRLEVAVANSATGKELADAIDAGGSGPAAVVAAFGGTTNLTALVVAAATFTGSACAGGDTPTAAQVDTAIDAATAKVKAVVDVKADNADVETLRTEAELRLDALETKVNAILAALKDASLMAAA